MHSDQVRTTIYLEKDLLLAAKKKALKENTSLTELVKKGLRSQVYSMPTSGYKDILSFEGIFKTKKKISSRKIRKAFEEALGRGEV